MNALRPAAKSLPKSLKNLLNLAISSVDPQRLILFGSRARGDYHEASDYDLAFSGLARPMEWNRFLLEVEDQPITLHKVDLVIYEDASPAYRKNIDKDGVILYER